MTPSNPSNSQPLIYRIADALGVFHLVAPVNHTHSQTEVDGLADALAAKANAVASGSPSGGIVVAATSGELVRSNKTVQDLLNAIDEKNSINQVDEDDEQEAHLKAIAEDDDVYFKFQLKNGDTEKQVLLTVSKMDNFARAISNPDSAPIASSDNLITSGAVAAALERSVSVMTSNIDVESLPNGKIIPISYLNTLNEAKNLYDIFSFDNVTTQVNRLAINTEDVEIPSSGRAFAFIMKETSESALGSMTTLHVWYQGAGRIVII